MSYTKLFSSITESSLWSESKEARLLFVSMLAKADENGFVEASVPGLARIANLTLKETEDALATLQSPDAYSKNPAYEGRRVDKVPGGWVVLNHSEYRNRGSIQGRREYMRNYMHDYRTKERGCKQESLQVVNNGHSVNGRLTQTETKDREREEYPPTEGCSSSEELALKPEPVKKEALPAEAKIWNDHCGRLAKVLSVTGQRLKHLTARRKDEFWVANLKAAVTRAATSEFCLGRNSRSWVATFDWVLKADTVSKIMEGKYDPKESAHQPTTRTPARPPTINELRTSREAKEQRARELKARNYTEPGLRGGEFHEGGWRSESARAEYTKLKSEIRDLNGRIAQAA